MPTTQAERTAKWIALKAQARAEKYIETDVADAQSQTAALRADVSALVDQIALLGAKLSAVQEDVIGFRNLPVVQAPQNGGATPWWEWVRQHVDACLDARFEEYNEAVGGALGEKARDIFEEVGREFDARKREHELLQREFATLKDEVALERGLQDLRNSVSKVQRAVPKLPALEAELRSEAAVAKAATDRELAALRRELKAAQHTICALQVKQTKQAKQVVGEQIIDLEVEQNRARLTLFPGPASPEAARALKEFAREALGLDGPVIIQH